MKVTQDLSNLTGRIVHFGDTFLKFPEEMFPVRFGEESCHNHLPLSVCVGQLHHATVLVVIVIVLGSVDQDGSGSTQEEDQGEPLDQEGEDSVVHQANSSAKRSVVGTAQVSSERRATGQAHALV